MKTKQYRNTTGCRQLVILFSGLMALLSASAVKADEITVERSYDSSQVELGTVTAPDGTIFQTINIPGLGLIQEPGSPQLPVEYIQILVPVYSRNFQASLAWTGNESGFGLDNRLFPAQVPMRSDGSGSVDFTFPSDEAYSEASLPDAYVVGDGYLDGCNHIVTVAVRPVSYNDASLESILYGNLAVSLTYDECDPSELESATPLFPPCASKYVNLAETVVNADDIGSFAYESTQRVPLKADKEYYYIIVPESLEEAVEDLAVWKRQKGYTVVTKTIEDILRTPDYLVTGQTDREDDAASLRAYLQDEFSKHGTFFCLLVGNYETSMPMRKFRTYKIPKNDNHSTEDFYLSDMYFSDLTTNWKVDKPSPMTIYTVYYDDAPKTYNAAIHVGRILATKAEELEHYMYKIKLYEANPGRGDNDYLSKALFFEQHQEKFTSTGKPYWYKSLINNSYPVRKSLESTFDITYLHDAYDDVPGDYSTGTEIIHQLSKHGWSSWHGHGSPFSCMVTDDINFITSTPEVDEKRLMSIGIDEERNSITDMYNHDSPSIVYSTSCSNVPFDELWNNWPYPNLAQVFTVGGKWGGPAFLGYTRYAYFLQSTNPSPVGTGPSTKLENYFFENLKVHKKIGIAESFAKMTLNIDKTYYEDNFNQVLIGEPEFEMWLGKPQIMSVIPQWSGNAFSFSGDYPDGLRISLSDGIGNVKTMLVNEATNTNIWDASVYGKDYLFSAWASGYLPVIRYFGQNNTLTDVTKKFIVRDAILGGDYSTTDSKFSVGSGASLSVDAIDAIETTGRFEVTDNGNVALQCDRSVTLEGSTVKSGGSLSVKAQKVTLKSGFKVEKGGSFKISVNK